MTSPWQPQVRVQGHWSSVKMGGKPFVFSEVEHAAKLLRVSYPDQYRIDRLDKTQANVRVWNSETGETTPAWRHA